MDPADSPSPSAAFEGNNKFAFKPIQCTPPSPHLSTNPCPSCRPPLGEVAIKTRCAACSLLGVRARVMGHCLFGHTSILMFPVEANMSSTRRLSHAVNTNCQSSSRCSFPKLSCNCSRPWGISRSTMRMGF